MEASTPRFESAGGDSLGGKMLRRLRLEYRSRLADRADALLAARDETDFEQAWQRVSRELTWNHRPSARRLWHLAKLPLSGTVVEIGSYMGNSTVFLALAGGEVHAVDPHNAESMTQVPWTGFGDPSSAQPENDPSAAFLANLDRFGVRDRVIYHRSDSVAAANAWTGGPVRFLYIDGLHTFEAVQDDYRAWQRWLAPEHIVLFDDYLWKEVEHAVKSLRRAVQPAYFYVRGGQAVFSTQPLPLRVAGLP